MPTYTVYFLVPYMAYEGIEAGNKQEAISQCQEPDYDASEGPTMFVAVREEK